MAYISPRLGLLNNLPMVLPFSTRLEIFQRFIESVERVYLCSRLTPYDRTDYASGNYERGQRRRLRATVHRTSLAEDGFDQLNDAGPALKGNVQITFIDK